MITGEMNERSVIIAEHRLMLMRSIIRQLDIMLEQNLMTGAPLENLKSKMKELKELEDARTQERNIHTD